MFVPPAPLSSQHAKYRWLLAELLLFAFLLVWQLAAKQEVLLLPVVGVLVVLALRNPWALALLGFAAVPFSQEVLVSDSLALQLPTEPLLVLFAGVVLIKRKQRNPALSGPALFLLAYFAWGLVAAFWAVDATRANKYWIMGALYALVLLQAGGQWLGSARARRHFTKAWAMVCAAILLYTLVRHASRGFAFESSSWGMRPFFNEHGTYATYLAFALGWFGMYALYKRKLWAVLLASLLLFGILVSYTRGAWLGVTFSAGCIMVLELWRRYRAIALGVIAIAFTAAFAFFQQAQYGSTITTKRSLGEHLRSTALFEGSVSNRERINRYVAAWAMAKEHPWVGVGPGCYVVSYAPYQWSRYKTHISTRQADYGGAHSEFLAALTETGWPGLLLLLGFYTSVIALGVRGFLRARFASLRLAYGMALAAWLTYIPHALVNNFTDQDKVAVPFYLLAGFLLFLNRRYGLGLLRARPQPKGVRP